MAAVRPPWPPIYKLVCLPDHAGVHLVGGAPHHLTLYLIWVLMLDAILITTNVKSALLLSDISFFHLPDTQGGHAESGRLEACGGK